MKTLPKKVGQVSITTLSDTFNERYSDHEDEETLLALFSEDNVDKKRQEILNNNPSWAMYYHLTPRRNNLLSWYEFNEGGSVLEVGAGCGAVTEALVAKPINVTALELTPRRSLINAHRNKHADNLNIVIGNLDEFDDETTYEYVVCVGVLEYAGTFYDSASPYEDFLHSIKKHLKPGGKLLLAIENRFGFKYLAGVREDHAHTFFEGLNGYPGKKDVQTFGKKELSDLVKKCGFSSSYFYYPYPDYKYPSMIYSDNYYPGKHTSLTLKTLPNESLNWQREHFFSEQSAMRYVEANDLFREFSNSFLVEVTA